MAARTRFLARTLVVGASLFGPLCPAVAAQPEAGKADQFADPLLTVAEKSEWAKTSTHADVLAFLDKLEGLPKASRLHRLSLGTSHMGKDIPLVIAAEPRVEGGLAMRHAAGSAHKLRILINANIHAGEVEGKTAVQMLLREIAQGDHADLLEHAVLLWVPIFNTDGNDRINTRNRRNQNGPEGGVGVRPNGQGLDLNRDFVKAKSPEVRGMLAAFSEFDPHVFMDLHTTNGSHHGYHLTYAPSLSTNVDPTLDMFSRETLLPEIRKKVADDHGFRVFDYGNFSRRGERVWSTYDHRPRFGTNYYGLRNRLGILSEAFSCVDFHKRVRVTRSFVLETVRAAIHHADEIRKLCAAADEHVMGGTGVVPFMYDTRLAPPVEAEVLVGEVERQELPGGRSRAVATEKYERVRMGVRDRFRSSKSVRMPAAWAIPNPPSEVVLALLRHGVELHRLVEGRTVDAEVFAPTAARRARRSFQGHLVLTLEGAMRKERVTLASNTLIVKSRQALGRVAAQLLEALSEDSLATWGYFDDRIADPAAKREEGHTAKPAEGEAGALAYPVVRLLSIPELTREALVVENGIGTGNEVTLRIVCEEWGEEQVILGKKQLAGHKLRWEMGVKRFRRLSDLDAELRRLFNDPALLRKDPATGRMKPPRFVLQPGKRTTFKDVSVTLEACRKAGIEDLSFGTPAKKPR